MAGTSETYSLGINVNYDSVNKAEHALGAVYTSLGKVGERADRLHMPSALPREINHIDTVTASYIQRLESEGRTYQADQQKIKAYRSAVAELSSKQKSLQNDLTKIAKSSGKASDAYRLQKVRINETATELSHFKSGLAATQKELKSSELVTRSYVNRLQAEGKSYEAAKAKLNSYKNSLTSLKKQQSIQTQELSRIAKETGKSSDVYKRQEVRVNQAATSIAKLNGKVKSGQAEVNKLNPHGFNKLANGAKHVTGAADKMKSGLKHAWGNVKAGATAAAAGIGAVGAAAISGAKKAGNLQQSYKEITNLAINGGEKQAEVTKNVAKMQSEGRSMSIRYGKSQQSIAEAYEDLTKRGYSTKQALGAMRSELQGSVASGDDFRDVVHVSSTTLESFGMRANSTARMTSNTKRVVNELAYAADMTSTGFKDLGYGMSYVGSSAHQAGFGLSETASAMGILSNNGLEASKAGTGLDQVINRLSNSAGKLKQGDKKNVLAQLGIKPQEIMNSKGQLKSLSTIFGVLNEHMQGLSRVRKINLMKSLFGTTGEQAGLILAKYNGQLGHLSKNTLKAGKTGEYVSKLASKNSQTANMQMARLKQAGNAFTMTLGAKMLPAINEAGNSLVEFLTKSKDGKRLTNDFAKAVEGLATGIVNTIKWIAHHRTATKIIATGLGAAYGIVKLASFVQWINKTRLALEGLNVVAKKDDGSKVGGIEAATKLSMGKRLGAGAFAGAAVATPEVINAVKSRHSASKRSQDIGGAAGALAGGTLTSMIPVVGPLLAPVGAIIGEYAGRWGGKAVNNFTKGWQRNRPPKSFWSMQNLGWSTHNMFKQIGSGWNHFWSGMGDWRKKQAQGIGQWANNVGRGWNRGVKGVNTWFKNIPSNLGKSGNHVKTWAGKVGSNIHKGWNHGLRASHNFFKNLQGGWNKTWKGIQRNRYVKAFRKGRGFQTAFKDMRSRWRGFSKWFGKGWNKTWKGVNRNRYVKAFKKGRFFQTAFKDMRSRWHGFSKWFGKGWNKTWKGVNRNRYVKAFKRGRGFQTALKDMRSRWHGFSKGFGKGWNGFWGKTSRTARRDWNGTKRNWNNFWGAIPKKWNSFKSSFGKAWGSFWSGVGKGFNDVVKGIRSAWDDTIGGIVKAWNDMTKHLGAFGKWISNSWTGTKNNVKAFANDISYATGGSRHAFKYSSHAAGGYIASDHTALVGEAGPELAYRNGRDARLLGANGPQVTKVNSGEHILNARDTARVMSGGLGSGLILRGYANGTTNLRHTSRNVTSSYNKITRDVTKSLKKLTRNNSSSWSKIKSGTTKQVTRLAHTNNRTWTRIAKQTRKQTDRTRRNTLKDYTNMRKGVNKQADRTRRDAVSDYTDMRKGVHKQMNSLHDGVIKLAGTTSKGFGKELDRMKGYAHSAMSGTIGQINKGISGIDKVLGQFGGNTSVIKPVKFTTGTDANGRLTQNTYAMVNDATSGPRQEALVSDKNEVFMPRGSNVTMMIPRGWGVLNGRQTQQAGLTHFAKGSGMSHSELIKLAEKSGRDSAKSFHDMYTVNVQVKQPDIQAGMTDLAKNASTKLGNAWSNAMWTVINNAIEGGSGGPARGLLKAVEDYGEGHRYVLGADGPSAFDCSGLVMYALRKRYGIDFPHYSGAQYARTEHISKANAKMGDLVFWGPGGGDHVGVYAGGNQYFSAQSPSQGIHMNTLSSVVGKGSPKFGRVKGLKQDTGSSKNAPSKALMALAKRELGSSALKWIENNLGDLANPAGDGVARWRKVIERAASVMHVSLTAGDLSHILTVIAHESGGNPTITNNWDSNARAGTPSKGLLQFVGPTFQHYAVKGHRNILKGYDQLLAMFNDSSWRQNLTLGGWGPTGARRYAKGGKPTAHTPFIAGENGPELITADGPVKVDTNETTKRKVQELANLIKFPKINRPTDSHKTSQAPTININLNGPISSEKDALKYASMIKDEVGRQLAQFAENVGDEFGSDPSVY